MPLLVRELLPELSIKIILFIFALPAVSIKPELVTAVSTSILIVELLEVILDASIVPAFSIV